MSTSELLLNIRQNGRTIFKKFVEFMDLDKNLIQ
jgi:hypothetical protein